MGKFNSEIFVKIRAHRRSRNSRGDQALVIPRGELLFWKFIELLKLQISNYKYQTISNPPASPACPVPGRNGE